MIRKFLAKFNHSVSQRVGAPRKEVSVPLRVSIAAKRNPTGLRLPQQTGTLRGETCDLSKTGIGVLLPAIRIADCYLVGEGRELKLELELPNGKISMIVVGQRYEQTDIHSSVSQFFIGANIVSMEEADREIYEEFLRLGTRSKGKLLQLNPDES